MTEGETVPELTETTGRLAPDHADMVSGGAELADVIEPIERMQEMEAGDPANLWTSDMILPGFGDPRDGVDACYPDCGDDLEHFCADCGHPVIFGRSKDRATCPRCAPNWARKRANSVVGNLHALRVYRHFKDDHQRAHHGVISPPAGTHPDAEDSWERVLEVCKEILAGADLEGYLFYHPYRGVDGDDLGAWKDRLFEDRTWGDDVRDELQFSPHFHFIVIGHKVPGGAVTRELEERTGWVLERFTKEGSNVSLYDEYDLARAVTYCLSHTGLYEAEETIQAAYRPFGKNTKRAKLADCEMTEAEIDALVRSVVPTTLGMDYNSLACGWKPTPDAGDTWGEILAEEVSSGEKVDLAGHQARRKGPAPSSAGSPDLCDCAGTTTLAGEAVDLPGSGEIELESGTTLDLAGGAPGEADLTAEEIEEIAERYAVEHDHDQEEPEECRGRLLSIGAAHRYLSDDKWRRQATHADELADALQEAAEREDWITPWRPPD